MINKEVVAVVVTYNRNDMLLKLLDCLIKLPLKKIVIIDNSEEQVLDVPAMSPIILYQKTNTNIGGAGGYNMGIKLAKDLGCDFVWLLDDDSIPEFGALNGLIYCYYCLTNKNIAVSYVCSKVLWSDSNEECLMNIPTYKKSNDDCDDVNIRSISSCSFVSVLIPLKAIVSVGLPIKDYFIWFDDVEYTNRLNMVGAGFQVSDSRVRHYTKLNQGANFGFINANNIVKYKYGIRNMISFYKSRKNFRRLLKIFFRIRKEMSKARVLVKYQVIVFFWFIKGLFFVPKVERFD